MAQGPSPYASLRPSERDLDFVAGEAGGNWRSLLTHLGIKFPEIQRLFSKNEKDSRDACFEGLFTWLSSEVNNPEEPVTFKTLFQALREAKMASCASLLEEKLEARSAHKPTGGDLSAQPGTSKSKENPAMANSSSKDHNIAEIPAPGPLLNTPSQPTSPIANSEAMPFRQTTPTHQTMPPNPTPIPADVGDLKMERLLKKYKDRIISHVKSKDISLRLKVENIIPSVVALKISKATNRDGNRLIYLHLMQQGDLKLLQTFGTVLAKEEGNPKMQRLGEDLLYEITLTHGPHSSPGDAPIEDVAFFLPYLDRMISDLPTLAAVLGLSKFAPPGDSPSDKCINTLTEWLKRTASPTVGKFCQCLENAPSFNILRETILRFSSRGSSDVKDIQRIVEVNRLALEKLQTAIEKHGAVTLHITRCILIGPPRVGKSCFKHLLVRNEPCLVKESTPVMQAPVVLTSMWTQQGKEGTWKELKTVDFQNLVSKCAMDGKYNDGKIDDGNSTAKPLDEQPKNEDHNSIPTADDDKPNPVVPAADNLSQRLSNFFQVMSRDDIGVDLNHLKLMHIFDCGGQLAFQDTIPLLINAPCAFIAIFNAFEGLDKKIELTYCLGGKELPTGHKETQRNMLRSILSSIQSLQYKCHQDLKDLIKEPSAHSFPIAVVGTHKDKIVHSDIDSIKDSIETQLSDLNDSMPCEFIKRKGQILNLVGNLTPNDLDQIVPLREEISKNASFSVNLPLPWLILELFTRSNLTEQAFYPYSVFKELCRRPPLLLEESDFKACIQILHILGFYAFYPLRELSEEKNWICTDAATLYKEVSKLLMVQHVDPGNNTTARFKETGRIPLKEEALKELFKDLKISIRADPNCVCVWLMHVLLHLGLAAKIKMEGEEVFIPLALPFGQSDIPSTTSVAPLCFTLDFPKDHKCVSSNSTGIPRGTFSRLVVLLLSDQCPGDVRNKWEIWEKDSKRSCIKFRLTMMNSRCVVYLKESMGHIEASVVLGQTSLPRTGSDDNRTREGSRLCQYIRKTLTAALKEAFEQVFGTRCQPKVVLGFACSECNGYNHSIAIIQSHEPSLSTEEPTVVCSLFKEHDYFLTAPDQLIWFNPGLFIDNADFKFTCKTVDGNKLWILEESSTSDLCMNTTTGRSGMEVALNRTDSSDCVQDVLHGLHTKLQRSLVVDKSVASLMYGWKPPLISHDKMAQINSQVDRGLPKDAFSTWYEHAHSSYTTEYLQEFCKCLRSENTNPKLLQVADLITKEIGLPGVGERSHSEQSPSTTQAKRSARDPHGAEQLHRQEYTQGPHSSPGDAPIEDVAFFLPYIDEMTSHLVTLGVVLGLSSFTPPGDSPSDKCFNTLKEWLKRTASPTVGKFCQCLKNAPCFNNLRETILPGVGEGSHSEQSPSTTQAKRSARDPHGAEQLHRQECTQGPPAPRTGMGEKIGCSLDILEVPEYRKGLIGEMKLLGSVLGIGEDTNAILRRHGSLDDHLVEILDLYIKLKTPTWQDFCKALKKLESFNSVRAKIERAHHDK